MIKKLVGECIILVAAILFWGCHGGNETSVQEKAKNSYQKTLETLLDKERKTPELFLQVKGKKRKNVIGQTVINGEIRNNAKLAIYKDIEVKIDFYSGTGTLLETDQETVYTELKPGGAKKFKAKYFAPKGTKKAAYSIIRAGVVIPEGNEK